MRGGGAKQKAEFAITPLSGGTKGKGQEKTRQRGRKGE